MKNELYKKQNIQLGFYLLIMVRFNELALAISDVNANHCKTV